MITKITVLRVPTFLYFIATLHFPSFANTYYLSEKGIDSNAGTSSTKPWLTLAPLTRSIAKIHPGDSILFERGSTFTGDLQISLTGTEQKPIYIGAYGKGRNPILNGGIRLSKWAIYKGNIWVTTCIECTAEPIKLLINGKGYSMGRFPDTGYRTIIETLNGRNSFRDTSLLNTTENWKGAEVVVRSSRWTIDQLQILSTNRDTIHYLDRPSYALEVGQGYFIQKHLNTLTRHGEWYFDQHTKKIFLYATKSASPLNSRIEVSQYKTGLIVHNSQSVTIEDLEFTSYQESGLQIKESDFVSINRIRINHSGKNGLEVSDCRNTIVQNSNIENSGNNGVIWSNNDRGEFIRNKIVNTGMIAGQGQSGNGTYIGLHVLGDQGQSKNNFQYNTIDSTGYIGIDFRTGGNTIRNNLIQNFCLIKDDGAGIYTWGNQMAGNTIEGNIILHGQGNGEGTPQPYFRYASGIYIDDLSTNITIQGNTIAYCAQSGILVHNSGNISMTNNTLVENGNHLPNKEKGQLYIRQDELAKTKIPLSLSASENKIITSSEDNYGIVWRTRKNENFSEPGVFTNNHYFAPVPDNVVAVFSSEDALCNAPANYNLEAWKRMTSTDVGSNFTKIPSAYESTRKILSTKNNGGWITWPGGSKSIPCEGTTTDCISINPASLGSEVLLYHAGFSLEENRTYRVSFIARSQSESTMEFTSLMANSPWSALTDYLCFVLTPDFKKYSATFVARDTCNAARLNFKTNQPWQIKGVLLEEVALAPLDFKLILNTSEKAKTIPLERGSTILGVDHFESDVKIGTYQSAVIFKPTFNASSKAKK